MRPWIRGVNLGGWLVLERFITPYLFALTSCHLAGQPCYYPGQIGIPLNHNDDDAVVMCPSQNECKPILVKNPSTGELDYPMDEYTLLQQFQDVPDVAKTYLHHHYDTFITRQDVLELSKAGITHVRVPMPHWIRQAPLQEEPYLSDDAWLYFVRLVGWCREFHIQVWPDLHTAPGSQNGFDNSGQWNANGATCAGWNDHPVNINRTLEALEKIVVAIHNDGLHDVVTGISILNEPYMDCDMDVLRNYNHKALQLVRNVLGNNTAVVIGDLFNATLWNDGYWEDTPMTYLDSHYYHVFAENTRALSPKQHIALACRKNARDVNDCCHSNHTSGGMSRLVGEWSAAYDTLPVTMLEEVMKGIRENGEAPFLHRNLSEPQRDFLKNFVKAQMVVYESNTTGVSSGWFYWNVKMEGGAFAEWDFLRGVREKWIPELPPSNVSSASVYGTCTEILVETEDDESIVHEYPDPKHSTTWKGPILDDDLVVSHGESLKKDQADDDTVYTLEPPTEEEASKQSTARDDGNASANTTKDLTPSTSPTDGNGKKKSGESPKEKTKKRRGHGLFALVAIGFFGYAIKRVFFSSNEHRRSLGYSSVHGPSGEAAVTMAV